MSKNQQNLDAFKILLETCFNSENTKIKAIKDANLIIGDKELQNHILRREQFQTFCSGSKEHLQKVDSYIGNEAYVDKVQKDFYLSLDGLKKEALKLMAKNQKEWFSKLFDKDFEKLKSILRSLIIFEAEHERTQIERIVQEIELVKFSK